MPIYQYKCNSCENVFEELRKISEYAAPCAKPCPQCEKGGVVERYIGSAPALSKTGAKTNLRVSDDFNHVLNRMHKFYKTKGSTIQTN